VASCDKSSRILLTEILLTMKAAQILFDLYLL